MPSSRTIIKQLFRKHRVLNMQTLQTELGNKSCRSIFRYLACEVYYSSFTHAGKYYTLKSTPHFNEAGLWFFDTVGFSKHGTLKQTLIFLINNSETGKSHGELKEQLLVRVHNTLLTLVQHKEVSRTQIDGVYIYTNIDKEKAKKQLEKRKLVMPSLKRSDPLPSEMIKIEILTEIIRISKEAIDCAEVTLRLTHRGIKVTFAEVEETIRYFNLKKKRDLS